MVACKHERREGDTCENRKKDATLGDVEQKHSRSREIHVDGAMVSEPCSPILASEKTGIAGALFWLLK
jgi:hypothetical protein